MWRYNVSFSHFSIKWYCQQWGCSENIIKWSWKWNYTTAVGVISVLYERKATIHMQNYSLPTLHLHNNPWIVCVCRTQHTYTMQLHSMYCLMNISFCLPLWCFFWVNCVHSFTLEWLRVYRNVNKPVPPAIIPTCLNFRTFGSDFLSGRMENWPDQERISLSISMWRASWGCPDCLILYHSDICWWQQLSFVSFHTCTHTVPFPLYTSSPLGPLKSMLSPIAMLSRYWDIFPPSGKEGWLFL